MANRLVIPGLKNLRDYQIGKRFTAGLVLTGSEIKSVRSRQVSLSEAYLRPQENEIYIFNMRIALYKHAYKASQGNDPKKKRKVLLNRSEINKIIRELKNKNSVLIPLQLFITERGWAKLEIALAQHLRQYQVKEKLKEKEIQKKLRQGDFD